MIRLIGEIASVGVIAAATWWRLDPLIGIIVGAGYVLLLVNRPGNGEGDDGGSSSR